MKVKMNRVIRNGKLDICVELVGGSADGMLCTFDLDIIKVARYKPIYISRSAEPIHFMPEYDEYVRVSQEKAVLRVLNDFNARSQDDETDRT